MSKFQDVGRGEQGEGHSRGGSARPLPQVGRNGQQSSGEVRAAWGGMDEWKGSGRAVTHGSFQPTGRDQVRTA